ncbi:MAG TPA: fibronectin type III domain-containing protein [Anaerolineales bacterium]|nr:fibronectin type III domain-containing protein [Anaerolineales bacterium]
MKVAKIILLIFLFVVSCAPSTVEEPTATAPAITATTEAFIETPEATFTPTETATPTTSSTPTIELSPTITATPTFAFPSVTVNKQAHCRYGPSVAYLHAADLYPGDVGSVRGRYIYSNWLHIKFDKLNYFCWVAPSVVDVVGDVAAVAYRDLNLQSIGSNMYGPPGNVTAVRDGNKVTISWNKVEMTLDDSRGYLLELFVCQDTIFKWWTDSYPDQDSTSYTVQDEAGCAQPSSGKLYTVEKHGFSEPATVPWPPP